MLTTPEEDDEEEHFVDVSDEDEDEEKEKTDEDAAKMKPTKSNNLYDGRKRDPRFSNADASCLWELVSCEFICRHHL